MISEAFSFNPTPKGEDWKEKHLPILFLFLLYPVTAFPGVLADAGALSGVRNLGSDFFYLAMILINIVTIIMNMEKVTDKAGVGERMTGLMNIAFMVIASVLVAMVYHNVMSHTEGIEIRPKFE